MAMVKRVKSSVLSLGLNLELRPKKWLELESLRLHVDTED